MCFYCTIAFFLCDLRSKCHRVVTQLQAGASLNATSVIGASSNGNSAVVFDGAEASLVQLVAG